MSGIFAKKNIIWQSLFCLTVENQSAIWSIIIVSRIVVRSKCRQMMRCLRVLRHFTKANTCPNTHTHTHRHTHKENPHTLSHTLTQYHTYTQTHTSTHPHTHSLSLSLTYTFIERNTITLSFPLTPYSPPCLKCRTQPNSSKSQSNKNVECSCAFDRLHKCRKTEFSKSNFKLQIWLSTNLSLRN